MIYFYLFSVLILLFRQYQISKFIVSPIYVYSIFSFVYTFFPYVYLVLGSEVVNINLSNLTLDISEILVLYVTVTNILIFAFTYTKFAARLLTFESFFLVRKNVSSRYLFFLFFPLVVYFAYIAPWPEYGEEFTINHSISAFLKMTLVFLFCAEVQGRNKKLYLIFLFLLMSAVFLIDSSRTFFFVFLFAFLFSLKLKVYYLFRNLVPVVFCFLFFVFVTLSRNDIPFSVDLILWPFYSEGIFGSYGAYNIISVYVDYDYDYFFIFGYFFDLLSSVLGLGQPYYTAFLEEYSGMFINGKLYPFGGHFFLSDAVLYFNIFAPIFYVLYFYTVLFIIHSLKGFPTLYVFLVANFFFIVKTPIFVFINTFLLVVIITFLYGFLLNVLPKKE